jgi:hypothetical protein
MLVYTKRSCKLEVLLAQPPSVRNSSKWGRLLSRVHHDKRHEFHHSRWMEFFKWHILSFIMIFIMFFWLRTGVRWDRQWKRGPETARMYAL